MVERDINRVEKGTETVAVSTDSVEISTETVEKGLKRYNFVPFQTFLSLKTKFYSV